jgi:hypothetical protein
LPSVTDGNSYLKKGLEIANRKKSYVGAGGNNTLRKNIAQSIAESIVLGRKEGLELAMAAIKSEVAKISQI